MNINDAFLYGAGDQKIGSIVKPLAVPEEQARIGKALKARFLKNTPALKLLREAVTRAAKTRGWLRGLDGRILPIRHQHAALNTLLQSAGALTVKQATVFFHQDMAKQGHQLGRDYVQLAHIHDEIQSACPPSLAEMLGQTCVRAMEEAGRFFQLRVPITGEYKIGPHWAATH